MSPIGLKKVAAECGLSPSTVSNILGSRGSYSEDTRDIVLKAVQKLGYTPNRLAKSLLNKSSPTVVVLATDLSHPYYAELLDSLVKALSKIKLEVMVGIAPWDNLEHVGEAYRSFLCWRPKAFLIITFNDIPMLSSEDVQEILKSSIIITLNRTLWPECPAVYPDRQAIIRLAVEHLMSLGHQRIGVLIDSLGTKGQKVRMIQEELQKKGLSLNEKDILHRPTVEQIGTEAVGMWFELGRETALMKDRPTAVIAKTEQVASWFIGGFLSEGGRIPRDLSVAILNNSQVAGLNPLPLTAIGVPNDTLSEVTVHLLQEAIVAREREEPFNRKIQLEPEIAIRNSSGPVPQYL